MKVMSSFVFFLGVILIVIWLSGCSTEDFSTNEKLQDLEFTVVSEARLPEELKEIVIEKKNDIFKLTYVDQGYLYICVGYGAQETGGYSISVNELYETENGIYVDTNLLGPKASVDTPKGTSYPYIAIKLKYLEKSVIFN